MVIKLLDLLIFIQIHSLWVRPLESSFSMLVRTFTRLFVPLIHIKRRQNMYPFAKCFNTLAFVYIFWVSLYFIFSRAHWIHFNSLRCNNKRWCGERWRPCSQWSQIPFERQSYRFQEFLLQSLVYQDYTLKVFYKTPIIKQLWFAWFAPIHITSNNF